MFFFSSDMVKYKRKGEGGGGGRRQFHVLDWCRLEIVESVDEATGMKNHYHLWEQWLSSTTITLTNLSVSNATRISQAPHPYTA